MSDIGPFSATLRERSIAEVERLGMPLSRFVPSLPEEFSPKSEEQIASRSLQTLASVSVAYGWSRPDAIAWLETEILDEGLSKAEYGFIYKGQGVVPIFMTHVESLNALLWSLGIVESLDCRKDCPNDLVRRVPNVKEMESARSFRSKVHVRREIELVEACDLYACVLHALSEAFLGQRSYPKRLSLHRVLQRLRALRWLLFDLGWDDATPDWPIRLAK